MNRSVLPDDLSNMTAALETEVEDEITLATDYLMYKIGRLTDSFYR